MATKQKNLTVLVVEFDEKRGGEATTRVANINGDDLHAMQGIVDGLIQGVALPHLGMTLWCNEDGALMPEKWPPHTTELAPFPVFGNFFLCRGVPAWRHEVAHARRHPRPEAHPLRWLRGCGRDERDSQGRSEPGATMNDTERKQWVENDEVLYTWWKGSRMSLSAFVKEYRARLTSYIDTRVNAPPAPAKYTPLFFGVLLLLSGCGFVPAYEGEPQCGSVGVVHAVRGAPCNPDEASSACDCEERRQLSCTGTWTFRAWGCSRLAVVPS